MRPALMSAMVLIFAKCLGEFGVPYVLGLPVDFEVLSTSLYRTSRRARPASPACWPARSC
jgi:iron(III) transport system permease protein